MSNREFYTNKGKFSVEPAKVVGRNQEGSLCWTNRQVWDITLARMREIVAADRVALPAWQWPRVYQISQNDNTQYCQCAQCEAAFAAEGSRAGALLQYVNHVAQGIARDYPDVKVQTFAYVDTEFLDMLRQAVKNEKQPLFYISNPARPYADGGFLAKAYRLLKAAQAAVPAGSDCERRAI